MKTEKEFKKECWNCELWSEDCATYAVVGRSCWTGWIPADYVPSDSRPITLAFYNGIDEADGLPSDDAVLTADTGYYDTKDKQWRSRSHEVSAPFLWREQYNAVQALRQAYFNHEDDPDDQIKWKFKVREMRKDYERFEEAAKRYAQEGKEGENHG